MGVIVRNNVGKNRLLVKVSREHASRPVLMSDPVCSASGVSGRQENLLNLAHDQLR